ncbi:VRR-NUC domain-containing protein [Bradyrhizobium sp. JYMT SZCCT0428]|uniref:VRR-NUC domain-containing protein n=1 Tax=Bradyrhizobium sp. JYMT SZCCT0428 TaxID=2807673 RepID=UPI001BAAE901|nr:VRR-NUC domain-containing protein [Bradyrhizobium sp. JYMT SZCCT0428]MBR1156301.1 VRR-NUC domain-containing protein [Bradyrhizobium sp. JYMT SZCCT0428]
MMKIKIEVETEHLIQSRLILELSNKLVADVFCAAIPNGGYRRPRDRERLKREGVRRGSPDLYFVAPNGVSAWLELKTPRGFLSFHQRRFARMCRRNRHLWAVAHSVEEALEIIERWGFLR